MQISLPLFHVRHSLLLYYGIIVVLLQLLFEVTVSADIVISALAMIWISASVLWLLALKGKCTSLWVSISIVVSIAEWLYQYGRPGPTMYLLILVILVQLGRQLAARSEYDRLELSLELCIFCLILLNLAKFAYTSLFLGFSLDLLMRENSFSVWAVATWACLNQGRILLGYRPSSLQLIGLGSLLLFFLFGLLQQHEYYYFFMGAPKFVVHPEFQCAKQLLLILGLFYVASFTRGSLIDSCLSLLFMIGAVVLIHSQDYLPRNTSPITDLQIIKQSSITELLFGREFSWRRELTAPGLAPRLYNELPFKGFTITVLEHGVLFGLLLLTTFLFGVIRAFKSQQPIYIKLFSLLLFFWTLIFPGVLNLLPGCSAFYLLGAFKQECASLSQPKGRRCIGLVFLTALVLFGSLGFWLWLQLCQTVRAARPPEHVRLSAPLVKQLVLAEDLLFFEHAGIDLARLKWTLQQTLQTKVYDQGGSTITMQLAKVRYLSFEKTLMRKFWQCLYALAIEQVYSKQEILEQYLDSVYFGLPAPGVKLAAMEFFGKQPDQLTVDESLLLVLSIKDPSHFNPRILKFPKDVGIRAKTVSRRLRQYGTRLDPYLQPPVQ